MTDMRRTLLWGVFLVSLFLLYDAWNKHTGKPSLFERPQVSAPAPVGAAPGASGLPTPTVPAVGAATPGAAVAAPVASAASTPARSEKIVVTTDRLRVTIDTQGGDAVRAELLGQVDEQDPKKNVVLFDQSADRLYKAQTGLIAAPGGTALPNHLTPMIAAPGERTLKDGVNELQLRLESPEVSGVKLVKTYTFKRGDYVIGVRHEVINASSAVVNPQLYLQLVRDGNPPPGGSSFYSTFTGPAVFTDASKFKKIEFKSIDKRKPDDKPEHDTSADNGWVAMVQHYFASAWLIGTASDERRAREFFTNKIGTNEFSVGMIVPLGALEPGASKSLEARLFVGPQEENKLSALAPGLELVKDYGLFKILSEPLFWLLTQLHKLIGNWGWAIVALVVLLKIAFYWLNASAYRSMGKMKAINPKVMEMRERLKDKPQQMQQEMMRIYREEKVNPLGGCLPIFVQMPFFIALYWVLLSSVEMRHTPWIGWITDLSAKDPYFILPLLMTASSMLQTWLNPTPPDPVQAKMMWIMPLVFSVMFFFFPAGLVLYWLTNNILSIAQQYLINKQLGVIGK
ncbi:membrane protein insertase YidC [Piscinibacter sp.]|jgi:YidC/Oxa1 family membrane protein insertase|uniref:membrane protein insertase YidC n=1 Tax=Piscinibacter sp. TaxID=1903157 RepID=UPI00355AB7FA